MMKILALLGANLWENHGYWIDKEHGVVQMNYYELPLLGKIGYQLLMFAFKHDKILKQNLKSIMDK